MNTPPPHQPVQPPPIQQPPPPHQAQQYQGPPIPIDLGYDVGSPGGFAGDLAGAPLGQKPIQRKLAYS